MNKKADNIYSEQINFFYNSSAVMLIYDPENGSIFDANPSAGRFYGWPAGELKKKTIFHLNTLPEDELREEIKKLLSGRKYQIRLKHRIANDSVKDVLFSAGTITIRDKKYVLSVVADITKYVTVEQEITSAGDIAGIAPVMIMITDTSGRFIYVNDMAVKTYGYTREEFMKISIWDLEENIDIDNHSMRVRDLVDTGRAAFEVNSRKKDGTIIPLQVFARAVIWNGVSGMLSISTDLTQLRRTEEYLSRTQKLDSLGVLAGGIAHDFNNLLGIIFGYMDLALASCPRDSEITDFLEKAMSGLNRSKDLTQQLLTFARGGSPVKKTASLTPLLKNAVNFSLSGSNIESSFNIDENLWLCDFDENQIGQVIDNIIINAKQAMTAGGLIDISAENSLINKNETPGLMDGKYVKITFSDTGIGMPSGIIHKIFDPFFTTKQGGSGLGLSTAYSIVKKHGGDITVESKPGRGTTFYLFLPASANQAPEHDADTSVSHRGSGRILVMDDEALILDITRIMLNDMGYEATTVFDGLKAVEDFQNSLNEKKPFKAVILDLTVRGGMGGKHAIQEIRKLDKKVPVIASSGYSDDPVISNPTGFGFTDSIKKPYNKDQLMALLNRLFPA